MTTVPIKIAVIAIGGQGGGVLAEWIVELAMGSGYLAQYTSVPGVAQRTGATIYYLELFPRVEVEAAGREPVMALMPAAGDVDIVIAAELMEAGRAMVRGFVSPDRTTLIASTHRVYGIGEKGAMGDGRGDPAYVLEAARRNARRFVAFDMAKCAEDAGSMISASLFGALAGSGALPFPREAYEATIRHGGVGVEASLRAFASAYANAQDADAATGAAPIPPAAPAVTALSEAGRRIVQRIETVFPAAARTVLVEGARRLADYQDRAYAETYLDRLIEVADEDRDPEARLTIETGRGLALWMSYEDVIRVADLKVRGSRFSRVRAEVKAAPDQIVHVSEFMHPRLEELADTLPAGLGRWIMRTGWLRKALSPLFAEGRRVPTTRLGGFLLLSAVAALRPIRRASLRYREETAAMELWLGRIAAVAPTDYALALEIAECQRLVKGYGDTHARGRRNFDALMGQVDAGEIDAARLRSLRDAALADEGGTALGKLLAEAA